MKKKSIAYLTPFLRNYKLRLTVIILAAIISGVCKAIAPLYLGRAVDFAVGAGMVDFAAITHYIVLLLIFYVLATISDYAVAALSSALSSAITSDMRLAGFEKIETLPISFFDSSQNGELMSRFYNDMELVFDGVNQFAGRIFTGLTAIIGAAVMMFMINAKVAVLVMLAAPLAVFVTRYISYNSRHQFARQQSLIGEFNGYLEEYVGGLGVVKAFAYEPQMLESAAEINQRLYRSGQKAQWYSSLVNPSSRLINNIAYMMVALIGGLSSGISAGVLSSLLNYATQFAKPMNDVTSVIGQLQGAVAALVRYGELMEVESEPDDSNLKDLAPDGGVKFDDVGFSYTRSCKLIEDFSINIPKGSMVAIVGPTGAGKTTMVNLLMRFYEPDEGKIYVGGQNIAGYKRDSVRLNFAMVLQDTMLFSGTVADNIAYGKKGASREDIMKAAKAAQAHGFIRRLANGYDTIIAEDADNISQGEKQLLTIARAMISDAPMLILDEATSSVDPLTEMKIQAAIAELTNGRTSFIIAHRLATIREADIIIVMNNGGIAETGNHEELLQKGGLYSELYNSI